MDTEGVLTAHAVGCETAVEQYHSTVRNVEGTGGRGSVVRALAAQASNLDSIPGSFPILFHIPFLACVCSINILLIITLQHFN